MGDLHAALRDRRQQPFGLETRDDFANGAERQAGEGHQFALRYELAR